MVLGGNHIDKQKRRVPGAQCKSPELYVRNGARLTSSNIIREPAQNVNPSQQENSGKIEKFSKREEGVTGRT